MQEKFVDIDGIRLRYKTQGSGTPVLLLHGWGGEADSFDALIAQLPIEDYQYIAPDFPGFGKTKAQKKPWAVADYMKCMEKFVDALGIKRFVLISHSFGGRVALKWALHDPKRITKMVQIASAGIKPKHGLKFKVLRGVAKVGKAVFSLPILRSAKPFMRKVLYKSAGVSDYMKVEGVMQDSFKKIIAEDLRPSLSKVSVPTILIWGKNDGKTPLSDGNTMLEEIPDSKLYLIEDGRHGIHKTHAAEVAHSITEFLKH